MSVTNVADIKAFCNFLNPSLKATNFTWAFLDSQSNDVIKGLGVYVGSIDEVLDTYCRACAASGYTDFNDRISVPPPTVHITLNQTNDKGRKNKDIEAARVFCVDLDYQSDYSDIEEAITRYGIEMVVESSPGKFHFYWQCSPSIRLEEWVKIQTALAGFFNGDLNLRSVSKTIRVPGFTRLTKSGEEFMPRIYYLADTLSQNIDATRPWFLTEELLEQSLAAAEERMKADKKAMREATKQIKKRLSGDPSAEDALVKVPEIGRNTTLYTLVKEFVLKADAEIWEESALVYGMEVNNSFTEPLEQSEVEQTVRSAFAAGVEKRAKRAERLALAAGKISNLLAEPIVMPMENETSAEPSETTYTNGLDHSASALSTFEYNLQHKAIATSWFSEQSIVERVLQRYRDYILVCDDVVMAFNPRHCTWAAQTPDASVEIKHFCLEVLIETASNPDIVYACLTKDGEVSEDKVAKLKDRLLSINLQMRVANAVRLSTTHPEIAKSVFDAQEHLFYCASGVVNMLTGEVREALPLDYLLSKSSVVYDPAATCPGWIEFLEQVFANNENPTEMVSLMQEVFGYSLGGSIAEQKVFIHFGGGSNGKSKVLETLSRVSGGYATYMSPDELTAGKSFGKAFEELGAKLEGNRLAVIDDLDSEGVWNEAFVKNITSPRIRARGKYEKSREFANRAKVHLGINTAPKANSESYGLLRRLFIIPYSRKFEPIAEVSKQIDLMIEKELSGILNWAIDGFRRWALNGLTKSSEVESAINDYKTENFVQENLVRSLILPLTDEDIIAGAKGEFVHDIHSRYILECTLQSVKPDLNQKKLSELVIQMYNLKAEKAWCSDKKSAVRKLQIKYKAL